MTSFCVSAELNNDAKEYFFKTNIWALGFIISSEEYIDVVKILIKKDPNKRHFSFWDNKRGFNTTFLYININNISNLNLTDDYNNYSGSNISLVINSNSNNASKYSNTSRPFNKNNFDLNNNNQIEDIINTFSQVLSNINILN